MINTSDKAITAKTAPAISIQPPPAIKIGIKIAKATTAVMTRCFIVINPPLPKNSCFIFLIRQIGDPVPDIQQSLLLELQAKSLANNHPRIPTHCKQSAKARNLKFAVRRWCESISPDQLGRQEIRSSTHWQSDGHQYHSEITRLPELV
ncbi:hypothetical protein Lpl7_0306 [Lacticaseibacillus paracasei subsp. tolerans Lpl7]|nr:hypothetical protein Lpl7_0306 [Lacticaseibacillus paracasei subsp. tolerans Lpl7]